MPDDHAPPPPPSEGADLSFTPTRAAGLARLEAFAPRAGRDYASLRNHDLPGHPHVSSLSPWTRHRAVTEAEICEAVLGRHSASAAEKYVSEVFWRTYFKGWMERRPATWDAYRRDLDRARDRLATEGGLRRAWAEACEGRTGIDPFDDWAREVVRTGYMHNHARMWFASVWMHTLRLPWALGADFFLRHLLDGDAASNTLSWRWVGGMHTKGRSYMARPGNIARYTGGRYEGSAFGDRLAKAADPFDDGPHAPLVPVPDDAPVPKGPGTGLVVHEDDLHPDFLWGRGLEADGAIVLIAPGGRSPLEVSRRVRDFTRGLAEDAAARLPEGTVVTDDPAAVGAWAREGGFRRLVAPHAPVGWVRAALDEAEAAAGLPMARPVRDWDLAAWPHATAGFFKVKKAIPEVLEAVGVG